MGRTSARLVPQGRQALGDFGSLRCGLNLNLNLNLNLYSQSQWLRIADYGLAALVPPAGAFVPAASARAGGRGTISQSLGAANSGGTTKASGDGVRPILRTSNKYL